MTPALMNPAVRSIIRRRIQCKYNPIHIFNCSKHFISDIDNNAALGEFMVVDVICLRTHLFWHIRQPRMVGYSVTKLKCTVQCTKDKYYLPP